MREVNLAGLDLNLLPALEALLKERNVTRAAEQVGLSQPAMSRALARLREIFSDPLLVRANGAFSLTPRAREIAGRLGTALSDVRGIFEQQVFDPAQVKRLVRFAATDTQTILIAPLLMARLARLAPGIDVRVEGYSRDLIARMEGGEIDFAFATTRTPLPPGALSDPLVDDELVIAMRAGHPAARKRWTLEDYARFDHVGIAIFGDSQSELDAELGAQGITRRMALVTPHFTAALAAVAATDMVTTLSRAFATRFADSFGLVLRPPPLADIGLTLTLVRTRIRDADPVLGWLRGVVKEAAIEAHGSSKRTARSA